MSPLLKDLRDALARLEALQRDNASLRREAWAVVRHWRTIRGPQTQVSGLKSGTDVLIERLEAALRVGEEMEGDAPW